MRIVKSKLLFSGLLLFLGGIAAFAGADGPVATGSNPSSSAPADPFAQQPKPPAAEAEKLKGLVPPFTLTALRARHYTSGKINNEQMLNLPDGIEGRIISYTSDGLKLYARFETALGTRDAGVRLPVLVLLHNKTNKSSYSTLNSFRNASDFFARHGFVVLVPDFRGYGDSEQGAKTIGLQIFNAIDALNLISGVNQISEALPSNISILGDGSGGFAALYALEANPNTIKRAILWGPRSVYFPEGIIKVARESGGAKAGQDLIVKIKKLIPQQQWPLVDPIRYLHDIKAPLIIQHGTANEAVPYSDSLDFVRNLDKAGVNYVLYSYDKDDSKFTKSLQTVLERALMFLRSS